MHLLSRIFSVLFDGLLLPFGAHRLAGLLVLSALTGAGLALLFRAASDQEKIRRARDVFKARVLEMRIYPDDFVLITRALFGALASQATYLRVALKPILVVLVVALPLFIQLEARFAHAPLRPGDRALVTATLKEGLDVRSVPVTLTGTPGVEVDPRPVRVPATREIVWRTSLQQSGEALPLTLTAYDRTYSFALNARSGSAVVGRARSAHGVVDPLIHPAGLPPIPEDSPVDQVRVSYQPDAYRLFGHRMGWLPVFLIGSMVGAILPAWLFKIQL